MSTQSVDTGPEESINSDLGLYLEDGDHLNPYPSLHVSRFTHHASRFFFMRIGIDIRPIAAAGQGRGLGIYAANLVKHLLQIDHEHQYALFVAKDQDLPDFLHPAPPNATVMHLRRPTRNIFLWDQLLWYPLLKRLKVDIFHSLIYGVPFLCPCKKVLTIHDLTPLIFPQSLQHLRHKLVFRFNFFTGKFADHIITVSTNSKHDAVRFLHIPEQRATVVLEGVSPHYRIIHNQQELQDTKLRYGIPGRFVLYVGGFDHHKNLSTLVKAFALLRQRHTFREQLCLVFVGGLSSVAESLKAEVNAQHIDDSVIFTGYVPEDDAVRLFNAADVFVLPSLYEGFGLPTLEAMACGTPVICSNVASLPEVVGNAALQFPPESPEELCAAMYNVLSNQSLQKDLRQKGLARIQQFSWENTARQTLAVYESVIYKYAT